MLFVFLKLEEVRQRQKRYVGHRGWHVLWVAWVDSECMILQDGLEPIVLDVDREIFLQLVVTIVGSVFALLPFLLLTLLLFRAQDGLHVEMLYFPIRIVGGGQERELLRGRLDAG